VSGSTPLRGLVAIGDSITRGGGDSVLGLTMRSWALWLAEALELPYSCLAADGAGARDALLGQVPRMHGPYELGCVYVGVNDVRSPAWDQEAFARDLASLLDAVAAQAEQLLILRLPARIGRPPAPALAIRSANATIAQGAAARGALDVALDDVAGPEFVWPDAVHLTARGQALLASRACERLASEGWAVQDEQIRRALAPLSAGAWVRYLLGAYAPALARDLRRRWDERSGPPD
jgi:hypothetical protein